MKIKSIITYTLLIFVAFGCAFENKKSEDVKFTKRVFDLSDPAQKSEFDRWVNTNIISVHNDTTANKYENRSKFNFEGEILDSVPCDFEDSNFEVYSACAGEFGGSLLFIDKKDKEKIYFLSSTCPKMIDFKDGKYIITSTLAHMSGSASVKTLKDPRRLPLFQKDKFINRQIPTPDSLLENIIDTFGVTGNIYYPYKKNGFLIFSKYDTAYVGEIKKGEIINTQPLLDHGIWSYGDKMNKIKNEIYISEINHSSTSIDSEQNLETTESVEGTIYIKQDTIILGYKYSKIVKKEK
jgi:hypothetical protein